MVKIFRFVSEHAVHPVEQVKASTLNIQRLLKAVTALDIATARGRHATWLQGLRPIFLSHDEASQVCTDIATAVI